MVSIKASSYRLSFVGVRPILTPAHAVHHISYLAPAGILFVGEAGGFNIDFGTGRTYLRPATPPRFDLEISAASIDRLLAEHPATSVTAIPPAAQMLSNGCKPTRNSCMLGEKSSQKKSGKKRARRT